MSCKVCGGPSDNMGGGGSPVLIHAQLGGHWEPYPHTYQERGRPAEVVQIERQFKVSRNGKLVWPWEG